MVMQARVVALDSILQLWRRRGLPGWSYLLPGNRARGIAWARALRECKALYQATDKYFISVRRSTS